MIRTNHKKCFAKAAVLTVLASVLFTQVQIFGAKGGGKDKKGYVLKFNGFESRESFQNKFIHQPGAFYKGSFSPTQRTGQQGSFNSIITYQKGNSIFILPYKYKVPVSKFKTPQAPTF